MLQGINRAHPVPSKLWERTSATLEYSLESPQRNKASNVKRPEFDFCLDRIVALVILLTVFAGASAAKQSPKPKLKVATDGFPSGHDTPEGAACDLARAFINRDEKLFSAISIPPYGGGKGRDAYAKFLRETIEGIKGEAAKKGPSLTGRKASEKCSQRDT
jgi:hypothetical protein